MLSYKESLKSLKEANALIEGHFILSSGLHSPKYIQCAQLMSKPNEANKICLSLAEKIKKDIVFHGGNCLHLQLDVLVLRPRAVLRPRREALRGAHGDRPDGRGRLYMYIHTLTCST